MIYLPLPSRIRTKFEKVPVLHARSEIVQYDIADIDGNEMGLVATATSIIIISLKSSHPQILLEQSEFLPEIKGKNLAVRCLF